MNHKLSPEAVLFCKPTLNKSERLHFFKEKTKSCTNNCTGPPSTDKLISHSSPICSFHHKLIIKAIFFQDHYFFPCLEEEVEDNPFIALVTKDKNEGEAKNDL